LSGPEPSTAFYCVASRLYFLGAVGLVNSLRLVGHEEPVFLLDCGLTEGQRALTARYANHLLASGQGLLRRITIGYRRRPPLPG
jgi:hypothetical protein